MRCLAKNAGINERNISSVIPINSATNVFSNLKEDRHHKLTIKQKNVIGR
ncbi:hypothetical protein BADSM9389_01230 [Buttiauxella agrestis]|nr:hypothetical protein BADSM9389_01230 [Buttiauxella agrestis]